MAIPGLVLIAVTAYVLLALPWGLDPLWRVETLTLAEAAALHDTGEIVRLIQRGEDPNRPGPVRADFLRTDPVVLTPLEAAVAADRSDVLEVLLDNGAAINEMTWTRLVCFAGEVEADAARSFLEARRPAAAIEACDHVAVPW